MGVRAVILPGLLLTSTTTAPGALKVGNALPAPGTRVDPGMVTAEPILVWGCFAMIFTLPEIRGRQCAG